MGRWVGGWVDKRVGGLAGLEGRRVSAGLVAAESFCQCQAVPANLRQCNCRPASRAWPPAPARVPVARALSHAAKPGRRYSLCPGEYSAVP